MTDIEGGLGLALVRGLSVAGCLSVLGAVVFRLAVAPPARLEGGGLDRLWRRLLWASTAVAVLAGGLWLLLQSADMACASAVGGVLRAVPMVAAHSRFGTVLLARLACLAAVPLVAGRGQQPWRLAAAALLAGIATVSQALHGHAVSMGAPWLALSAGFHLLAAGLWLGQLLPLWLFVRYCPDLAAVGRMLERFSPLGLGCVGILAVTALAQGGLLAGGPPGLIGTAYGRTALVKACLFAALLAIAAANRFLFLPGLATGEAARGRLVRSLGIETLLGIAVIAAAAILTSRPPGMHEQPLWPFSRRPSLVALADPGLRREVLTALGAIVAALVLLGLTLGRRRLRWPAAAVAAIMLGLALPHLDLLFVEAYPTSYFVSPTGFAAAAIVRGGDLFRANCVSCHGVQGRGDGPRARELAVPPADLTADHLWEHADGELFWWLSHGIDGPDGGQSMPGFAATLGEEDRWDLIDYVRANNAGLKFAAGGAVPLMAPDFDAECADGRSVRLSGLRGKVVHVVSRFAAGGPLPPGAGEVVTVSLSPADPLPAAGACRAADHAAWDAVAIVAGIPAAALDGVSILVDPAGWLRARWRPGDGSEWNDPARLAAFLRQIRDRPLGPAGQGAHLHHH